MRFFCEFSLKWLISCFIESVSSPTPRKLVSLVRASRWLHNLAVLIPARIRNNSCLWARSSLDYLRCRGARFPNTRYDFSCPFRLIHGSAEQHWAVSPAAPCALPKGRVCSSWTEWGLEVVWLPCLWGQTVQDGTPALSSSGRVTGWLSGEENCLAPFRTSLPAEFGPAVVSS